MLRRVALVGTDVSEELNTSFIKVTNWRTRNNTGCNQQPTQAAKKYQVTDVSEELSASFIRVTRIDELKTTLAVTSNRRTLKDALSSSETSVLIGAIWRNIPEDTILHF
jgi:hypothetical protein